MIVQDILSPYNFNETDPFILWHGFGPMSTSGMPPIGMHPHRGFCEVPYLKQGHWNPTDYWNPRGGHHPPMQSGCLQWGKVGSGIEHGVNFDKKYQGKVEGFQLWVNLPAHQKLDPPCFQDALPEALPERQISDKVKVKVLVGSDSPIDTGDNRVEYVDYMLAAGGEAVHTIPPGYSAVFAYVYSGAGSFGSTKQKARKTEVLKVMDPAGQELHISADQNTDLGVLLLVGQPLNEKIVQHGPFVMSTKAQLQQAFQEFQSGRLCNKTCDYVLHKAGASERSQCTKR